MSKPIGYAKYPNPKETCCDDEANHEVRETDSGLCPKCKEHSGEIACKVCGEMVFISACCG